MSQPQNLEEKLIANANHTVATYPARQQKLRDCWKYVAGIEAAGIAVLTLSETIEWQRVGAYGMMCGALCAGLLAASHVALATDYRIHKYLLDKINTTTPSPQS
jgi:hypothetical protein